MEEYAPMCGVARFCWFCSSIRLSKPLRNCSPSNFVYFASFLFQLAASGNSMDSLCHRSGETLQYQQQQICQPRKHQRHRYLGFRFQLRDRTGGNYSRHERILISVKWQRHISDGFAYDESYSISDAGRVETTRNGGENGKVSQSQLETKVLWVMDALISFNKIPNARHKANLKINFMFAFTSTATI